MVLDDPHEGYQVDGFVFESGATVIPATYGRRYVVIRQSILGYTQFWEISGNRWTNFWDVRGT